MNNYSSKKSTVFEYWHEMLNTFLKLIIFSKWITFPYLLVIILNKKKIWKIFFQTTKVFIKQNYCNAARYKKWWWLTRITKWTSFATLTTWDMWQKDFDPSLHKNMFPFWQTKHRVVDIVLILGKILFKYLYFALIFLYNEV